MSFKRLLVVLFVGSLLLTACGGSIKEELAVECLNDGGEGLACDYFYALQDLEEAQADADEAKKAYDAEKEAEKKKASAQTATAEALLFTPTAFPTSTATPYYTPTATATSTATP